MTMTPETFAGGALKRLFDSGMVHPACGRELESVCLDIMDEAERVSPMKIRSSVFTGISTGRTYSTAAARGFSQSTSTIC